MASSYLHPYSDPLRLPRSFISLVANPNRAGCAIPHGLKNIVLDQIDEEDKYYHIPKVFPARRRMMRHLRSLVVEYEEGGLNH